MKIYFFPDYTITNPYQNLLYSGFESPDVTPGDIDTAIEDVQNSTDGQPVVFHLHWQNVITGPARNSHEHRIMAKQFLSKIELFKSCGGYLIWTIHNKLPHDTKFLLAEREYHSALSDHADIVHLHDETSIEIVNQEYKVRLEKIRIIPHGNYISSYPNEISRVEARKALKLPDSDMIFGFIGQLRPYKGLTEFIEASVPLTRKSNVTGLIAGKPVWPFTEGKITNQCSPFSKIRVFEGFVADEDLQLYLNSSDIIVLPYRDILTSGSILLAASYGKPVVVPDIPAFRNIKLQKFVFTYDPIKKNALSELMQELSVLNSSELAELSSAAFEYAKELDWAEISHKLVRELESLVNPKVTHFEANLGDNKHLIDVYGESSSLIEAEIAICVVNYKSYELIKSLSDSIKRFTKVKWKLLILDNSESESEFIRLCSTFRGEIICKPQSNLGYAGGNNVLVNLVKSIKPIKIGILNPDIIFTEDLLGKLIPRLEKDSIHSPLVLKENGQVSFHSATIDVNSKTLDITHHYDGKELSSIPPGKVTTDILNGCALFFDSSVVDKFGYIPEEYFLYFEESDWTWGIKKAGGRLEVHTDCTVTHAKDSQKGGLPSVPYTYYLLRSALLFASKFGFDIDATKQKYLSTFVTPWEKVLKNRAPDFLHCFKALCTMALEHGIEGIQGPIDILGNVYKYSSLPRESEGFIEGCSGNDIRGWAVADKLDKNKVTKLLYFVNSAFEKSFEPSIERQDISALGYRSLAAFSLPIGPRDVLSNKYIIDAYSLKPLIYTEDAKRQGTLPNSFLKPIAFNHAKITANIDGIKNGRVNGWAFDAANPKIKVELEILINGESAAIVVADKFREDLHKIGLSDGRCAFEVVVDPALLDTSIVTISVDVLGNNGSLLKKDIDVELTLNGYEHHTNFKKFMAWSYENVVVPYGQYEKSLKLQRELEFIRNTLVDKASDITSQHKSLISVIMPAYNRADVIGMAIMSVLNQSYQNFELIVIDDGSDDQTCNVVKELFSQHPEKNTKLIRASSNGGVSAARNLGLAKAKGELIAYLDSDNEWYEDYLLLVNAAFYENPMADSAYAGQEIWFSDSVYQRKFRTSVRLLPYNRSKIENSNFIDLNVFSHRKSLLKERGGFREDIRRLVDWELILRYTEMKPPVLIPALMNRYFFGLAGNQITSVEGFEKNLIKLLEGLD